MIRRNGSALLLVTCITIIIVIINVHAANWCRRSPLVVCQHRLRRELSCAAKQRVGQYHLFPNTAPTSMRSKHLVLLNANGGKHVIIRTCETCSLVSSCVISNRLHSGQCLFQAEWYTLAQNQIICIMIDIYIIHRLPYTCQQ